ncbi:hypothetical protein FRB90_006321 [Tulasnella sp. 427]|nr:hypothetical protein FRB90_006321 [Tulasnella sp. 427]
MNHPGLENRNQAIFELPLPPDEFGQDGGKFYRCYDTLAEEIDDDMVKGLKEQLDGLLIFAGLFAGVNSAFLGLTLPLMSANPADDTNALLRENNAILMQLALGRNDSLPSTLTLPSERFSPAGKILTVNILFSVSLTLALLSSFLAVVGRQWLAYYRKRSGGGPDKQRWEQLKRFLGAQRWGLEWILDDFLPSLIQIGLIIFSISLTIYASTLHSTLSTVVGVLMCSGLTILVVTALLAIWDQSSPFQSPLSRFIPWATFGVSTTALYSAGALLCLIQDFLFLLLSFCLFLFRSVKVMWNTFRHPEPARRNSSIRWKDFFLEPEVFSLYSKSIEVIESISHFLNDKEARTKWESSSTLDPAPPTEFGQDGDKFYHRYDAFAEEIDENTVASLKEQLDELLIFAGLFAGVNSAFLALTLPPMSPDPADNTNALLRKSNSNLIQVALGRNDSLPIPSPLPSEGFSPSGKVLTVNILFSGSLTLALVSSFMTILGRQWLVYYRKRSGGGPDRQRWEQLKRFLGAQRWGLEWILDDFIPSILQVGLILFGISLTVYLSVLHLTLSRVVGVLMCAELAILVITALLAIWEKSCPFQSPLSRFTPWAIRALWATVNSSTLSSRCWASFCISMYDAPTSV